MNVGGRAGTGGRGIVTPAPVINDQSVTVFPSSTRLASTIVWNVGGRAGTGGRGIVTPATEINDQSV